MNAEEIARRNEVKFKVSNLSERESAILNVICEANGITEEDLIKRTHNFDFLSMMFFNFPKISCLQFFPSLRKLQIMQQSVSSIEGLDACNALEELWVVESTIEKIEHLHNCMRLKKLYLYSNRIRRIENLGHLQELEVLSLANNRIFLLENLEELKELKELNLANNLISGIGDALVGLQRLHTLNLAGNSIGSFKEVGNLSPYRVPSLRCLYFADPLWGHCPLTSLCNYQTYVLFILQHITSLDSIRISEEAKQLAEATYLKKKMYYNMRIKTLRRNTSNIIRIANEGKHNTISASSQAISSLSYHLTMVDRELVNKEQALIEDASEEDVAKDVADLKDKKGALEQALSQEYKQVATAENVYDRAKESAYAICNTYVRRMAVELETGGNIRLEDGSVNDLWYKSCVDLVKSRSFMQDFKALGVWGTKVVRVTRIHNRYLRHKFVENVHSLTKKRSGGDQANNNGGNDSSIEYLFYGEHLGGIEGELSHVIEEGFRPSAEYASMGLDGAAKLTNSMSLACHAELKEKLDCRSFGGFSTRPTSQLIIAKVFLGRCTQSTKDNGGRAASSEKEDVITRHTVPGYDALFRVKASDPKQRLWYIFDTSLVLPEYVVEFEYEVEPSKLMHPSFLPDNENANILGCNIDDNRPEIYSIGRPLQYFLEKKTSSKKILKTPVDNECNDQITECERYKGILELPPVLSDPPKAYIMTIEILRRIASPAYELENLTYLNLSANRIRRIENLNCLPRIKTLILSFNQIMRIEGFENVAKTLETVDLDHNQIRKIEGMSGLHNLRSLKLENNLLFRLEDVNVLRKYVPNLTYLSLRNNSICESKSYQSLVLKRLEKLEYFDGVPVSSFAKENIINEAASCSLTLQLIKENAYNHARLVWLRSEQHRYKVSSGDESMKALDELEFWSEVEELELDHKKIRKMENLQKLTCLKRLSLCDNEITRIEGLEDCNLLEELCLEDNRLQSVDGLGSLRSLKKLDLGRNKIMCVTGFAQTFLSSSLTQLSLEDNEITSLGGLSCLKNLLELYIGNNRIAELREIQLLKHFGKLIILDLLGNPLCDEYDYRGYTIYHLKKLKVLDGASVEPTEQAAARSKYLGRLTIDMLEEQVGHRFFDHLRDLDISNLRLRDVFHAFSSGAFTNLCELNLDNNLLHSVAGLQSLANLQVLRLNNNRLENATFCEHSHQEQPQSKIKLCDCCFPRLEVLQLGANQVGSLRGLQVAGLKSLKTLFLHDNTLSRIDGLMKLPNLQELILDGNRIKYIDQISLQHVKNLREMRIDDNGLRSLQHVCTSVDIAVLHAANNRISDIVDLDHLAPLKDSLTELNLSGNPVARKGVYRSYTVMRFPMLTMLDGRPVTSEERCQAEAQYTIGSLQAAGIFVPTEYFDSNSLSADPSTVVDTAYGNKVSVRLTNMSFEGLGGNCMNVAVNGNLHPPPDKKSSGYDGEGKGRERSGKKSSVGRKDITTSFYTGKDHSHLVSNSGKFNHTSGSKDYISSVTFVPANHRRSSQMRHHYWPTS